MRNSKSNAELIKENEELKVQIATNRTAIKTNDSNKKFFYVISQNNNEVQLRSAAVLPEGNLAYWEGPSGNKTLKTQGSFKEVLKKLEFVSGYMCTKIKPLLKEMGYKYSPKAKQWDNNLIASQPQALTTNDLPY